MKTIIVIATVVVAAGILFEFTPRHPELAAVRQVVFENDRVRLTQVGVLDNLSTLVSRDGRQYAMEDHFVYVSTDGGRSFERRGALPKPGAGWLERAKDVVARSKIVRTLRRNRGPVVLQVLPSGTIVIIYDQIYRSADGGYTFEGIPFPAPDFVPPFNNSAAVLPDGDIFVGEYPTNDRPHPVRVLLGTNDARDWSVAYEFPSGELFHVHGLVYQPEEDRILVLSGDRDYESKLLATSDRFGTFEVLGAGDQGWRIVSLTDAGGALIWGSDNDQTGAQIFRFDGRSREPLAFIGNTSYDSIQLADGTLAVSTTLEPKSVFVTTNPDYHKTSLWLSPDGREWVRTLDYEQDPDLVNTPIRPRLKLPAIEGSDNLVLVPSSMRPEMLCDHPCTTVLEVEWKSNS